MTDTQKLLLTVKPVGSMINVKQSVDRGFLFKNNGYCTEVHLSGIVPVNGSIYVKEKK